ncbi:hypothetical protein V6Z11_D05G304700 [Gossypium hirsutum]
MFALLYTLLPSFLAFFFQSGSLTLSVSAWVSAASGTHPTRGLSGTLLLLPQRLRKLFDEPPYMIEELNPPYHGPQLQ